MAASDHISPSKNGKYCFVQIKSEPTECNLDIKVESPDEDEEDTNKCDKTPPVNPQSIVKIKKEDDISSPLGEHCVDYSKKQEDSSSVKIQNIANITVKIEKQQDDLLPEIENITVKVEPDFYCSSEDEVLANYQNSQKTQPKPQKSFPPNLRIPRLKRTTKCMKADSDEEYVPKRKKRKEKKEEVKKTYTTKAKKKENCYSENVTKHIELVTITEEERLVEYKELWQSRKHMRYMCQHCAIGFVMEEPYVVHMKSHSVEAGEFECTICHCRLRSDDQLYKHRLRHYRRYRCALCRRIHKDKETAASHVMSEHIREAFTCDQCGKGFKRPAYLKKHIAQQHTKGDRYECSECARVFFDRSMYKTHYRRHNEEVRNPVKRLFICDTCCAQFKRKEALKRHLLVHENTKTLSCGRCPALFHTRRGLRLHELNKHTDQGERRLQPCPHCARECTTAPLLRLHIRRMHTDRTRKYQCDHCKRLFYTKGEIRAHIVWSHLSSRGARALFCCGREFRTRTRLRDHVALRHLRVQRQKAHACDQCNKAFVNNQVLTRHKKSHLNLTYPCPICNVRFKSESYVKVHHQLKHLNMTRAEIKAQRKLRQGLAQQQDKVLNGGVLGSDVKEICFEKVVVKQEVDSECDISVPLFDFEDLRPV